MLLRLLRRSISQFVGYVFSILKKKSQEDSFSVAIEKQFFGSIEDVNMYFVLFFDEKKSNSFYGLVLLCFIILRVCNS